jgi:hypothetical protein
MDEDSVCYSGRNFNDTILLIVISLLIVLFLYRKLLQYLDHLAWEAAKERMVQGDAIKDPFPLFTVVEGRVLTGMSPNAWGVENIFQMLIHRPIYLWRCVTFITYYLPRDFARRFIFHLGISDQVLLDLVLNTLLVMLCEIDSTGELVTYRSDGCNKGIFINGDTRSDCVIDGSTLVIHFRSGRIESAVTGFGGPVTAGKWLSRNEILADALHRTVGLYCHPQVHMAGERCAGDIARKQIEILYPSALHCHSLHEGLLHGPNSPICKELNLFSFRVNRLEALFNGLSVTIPHNFDRIKMPKKFRFFNYLLRARNVTINILKKYDLLHVINIDDFFALVVMHDLDHANLYQFFSNKLPLHASLEQDRFHYYLSMHQNLVMCQFYTPPIVNLLWPMSIKDSTHPLFQDLYRELARIDPEFAGFASCNISF